MNHELIAQTNQNIGYEGKVTLSIFDKERNKITNTIQIHNTGTVHMFNFLANCLIAKWNTAQANYPSKIVIFKKVGNESTFIEANWNSANALTPDSGILQSSVPLLVSDYDTNSCAVKFHFRIPTALISSVGNAGKIGLYSRSVILNQPLAYVFINTAEQTELSTAANNPNLVIILDWVLTIANQVQSSTASNSGITTDTTSSTANTSGE